MPYQYLRTKRFLLVAFMTGATVMACSSDVTDTPDPPEPPEATEQPEENVIQLMASETFDPSLDTVAVNTTIEWRNTGGIEHTLTSDDDEWEHENVPADASWTYNHTFDAAGTYDYHCEIHSGMTGRIVVE